MKVCTVGRKKKTHKQYRLPGADDAHESDRCCSFNTWAKTQISEGTIRYLLASS